MAKINVPLYNTDAEPVGEISLPALVFGVKPRPSVIQEAFLGQQERARQPFGHTQTRGEVRGGGKKPWKQKGTGRARHGSIRSPLWKGGGVTFGPRSSRTFSLKVNRKLRRQALRMLLTERLREERLFIVTTPWTVPEGKTKHLAATFARFPSGRRPTLLLTELGSVDVRRAARNLPFVTLIAPDALNVKDLLTHEFLFFPKSVLPNLLKTYGTIRRSR